MNISVTAVAASLIDFEHGSVSESRIHEISDEEYKYYKKLSEKTFSGSLRKVTVGSQNEAKVMLESMKDDLAKGTYNLACKLFALGSENDAMPDATLICMIANADGDDSVICVKTDHKALPFTDASDGTVITTKQLLPSSPTVSEAIVLRGESLYLQEKKYPYGETMTTYLNERWVHGDEEMSDKEKLTAVKKSFGDNVAELKSAMEEAEGAFDPFSATDDEEIISSMKERGLKTGDVIETYPENSDVKVATSNGRKITCSPSDIIEGKVREMEIEGKTCIVIFDDEIEKLS